MTYSGVNYDCGVRELPFTPMADEEPMAMRITRMMEAKNLNQSELARILGVSRMTVSQWCNGTSEPRPENLLALAEVLTDGDAHYLVHGPTREPKGGYPAIPGRATPPSADPGSSGTFKSPFRRRRRT